MATSRRPGVHWARNDPISINYDLKVSSAYMLPFYTEWSEKIGGALGASFKEQARNARDTINDQVKLDDESTSAYFSSLQTMTRICG